MTASVATAYRTVDVVADEVGVSPWLVRKDIREGRLKAYRFGGSRGPLRIFDADFTAWMDGQVVEPRIAGQW